MIRTVRAGVWRVDVSVKRDDGLWYHVVRTVHGDRRGEHQGRVADAIGLPALFLLSNGSTDVPHLRMGKAV